MEIDSTISTLGLNQCLNSKTDWGMSKDPTLVHRTKPVVMSTSRAQREGQTSGNTAKRVRVPLEANPRPSKKRRQDEDMQREERDSSPDIARSQEPGPAPGTSKRSRWSQWRQAKARNESKGPEVAHQDETQPTTSGLLGPLVDLRSQGASRHPSSSREGQKKDTSTNTGPSEGGTGSLVRRKSWGKTQRRLAWPSKGGT